MQVFVTPDHDTSLITSDIVELTDDEIEQLIVAAKQGEYQLHSDCYGDDYANVTMIELGL